MGISIGIVGLPNVGKSTLFNALTRAGALVANYPFATIEPNTGVVPIPDPRLEVLAAMFSSRRMVPATVTFVDIAGLVRGASEGEGLGNRFLAHIREVEAVCHVVRAFSSPDVAHVGGGPDPAADIETVNTELALADLEIIDRRLPRLEKEATVDRSLAGRVDLLRRARARVAEGALLSADGGLVSGLGSIPDLKLLTAKRVIYVFNVDEAGLVDPDVRERLAALVTPAQALFLDAEIEAELGELDEEDRLELLRSVGQEEPGLHALIRAAYRTLGLHNFLTAGEKEARAWTIPVGATAYQAAGEIHRDFQRGFIAAEVVDFETLVEAGSWAAAKAKGLVRTEGRDYLMRPDDVVLFRFNL